MDRTYERVFRRSGAASGVKTTHVGLTFAVLCVSAVSGQQEDSVQTLDRMVVTAGRIPVEASHSARNIAIIDRSMIESSPARTVEDLLEYVAGVDVRQRGGTGMQSDVSVRGGSFEQTLLMIDGVRVRDPQTGHHSFSIPIGLDEIERIEIVRGHGARMYGPDAYGGTVNIITRNSSGYGISLGLCGGENGYTDLNASARFSPGPTTHSAHISRSSSSGYRYNTATDALRMSYAAAVHMPSAGIRLNAGYVDKEFGANDFWAGGFPDQWEHTRAGIVSMNATVDAGNVKISPVVFWRRHFDDFMLDRMRPDRYRNEHTTDSYGAEVQFQMHTPAGPLALGCEGNGERIESSNLGGHDRIRAGVFVEQRIELIKKIFITAGAYAYRYSEWGWRVWPGIDICFNPNSIVAVFGSAGYSFRVPTFTELYYTSPSNSGNPDLRPEEAISYEAGVRAGTGMITGSVGVFARDGTNNIDWIRPAGTVQWHADNIAEITAYGMESECVFHPRRTLPQIPVTRVSIGAASLLTDRQEGAWESKYVLDYLKHQVLLGVHYTLFPGMAQQWNTRYERRKGDRDGHIIVDSRIMYRHGPATFYVEATNITDRSYDDIASVPMPGRWVKAGLTIAIFYGERIERSNL